MKTYVRPEIEVLEIELTGMLAASQLEHVDTPADEDNEVLSKEFTFEDVDLWE